MNWRKSIIYFLWFITGSKVPANLKYLRRIGKLSFSEQKRVQEQKLKEIILHAYKNVPYYKDVLKSVDVVTAEGEVDLANFRNIPLVNNM